MKLIRQDNKASAEPIESAPPAPAVEPSPAPARRDPVPTPMPTPARAVEAVPDLVDTTPTAEDDARRRALAQLAAKQVTQAQVAEQFGVHVRTVRRWASAA